MSNLAATPASATRPTDPRTVQTPYYVMVRALGAWAVCARWAMAEGNTGPVCFVEITSFADAQHGSDTERSYAAALAYWKRLAHPI